jgi:drug/metabolite transporter (DMT)-like permease
MINRRIDPALDKRRLVLFFAGLIIFYAGVLLIARPELNGGEAELAKFVLGVMLAPTGGAILAERPGPVVLLLIRCSGGSGFHRKRVPAR